MKRRVATTGIWTTVPNNVVKKPYYTECIIVKRIIKVCGKR